jgi:hypothetical protein
MTMKAAAFALLAFMSSASAAPAVETSFTPVGSLVVPVNWLDWQGPDQLPPRFRNHCTVENFTNRPYCSDHCGADYQFFFCSPASFGCCHLGHGYCDWNGVLRCHP